MKTYDLMDLVIPFMFILIIILIFSGILFNVYLKHQAEIQAIEYRCEAVQVPNKNTVWTNCKGPVTQEIK